MKFITCGVSSVLNVKDYFCLSGDIQIGMVEKKGALEVEVIRARGLVGKPGSKALPGKWTLFNSQRKMSKHDRLACFCPAVVHMF